ncbi:MAG: alpha/beta fold hydrolase, partial [Rhodospirillales bacterium]
HRWHPFRKPPRFQSGWKCSNVPTLVLWGESDAIVTPAYGRAYAGLIPGARFETIAAAGHHPELEQPAAFVDRVVRFLTETTRS